MSNVDWNRVATLAKVATLLSIGWVTAIAGVIILEWNDWPPPVRNPGWFVKSGVDDRAKARFADQMYRRFDSDLTGEINKQVSMLQPQTLSAQELLFPKTKAEELKWDVIEAMADETSRRESERWDNHIQIYLNRITDSPDRNKLLAQVLGVSESEISRAPSATTRLACLLELRDSVARDGGFYKRQLVESELEDAGAPGFSVPHLRRKEFLLAAISPPILFYIFAFLLPLCVRRVKESDLDTNAETR